MFLMMMAMLADEPINCPPAGTAARDRLQNAGVICSDDPNWKPPHIARTEAILAENRRFRQRGADFPDRPFPASMQARVRAFMESRLRDAPATRYKWPLWKHPDVYCFEVNGKNAFGGYTGWKTHVVSVVGNKIADPPEYTDCEAVN